MITNLVPGFRQLASMGALPWFCGIALVAFMSGAGISGYTAFKLTRSHYRGEALQAKLQLSKFETSLADLRAENLKLAQDTAAKVLEVRDAERTRIDGVVDAVRDLGQRVRLCATKSDVRISVTPAGSIETVPGGQLRDAAEAVREFAEACARERDRDAADHNALIDWLEKMGAARDR